jgi:hypothetical protein
VFWDASPIGGGNGPVPGAGRGRETERGGFKQAYNRLATCLQLACNLLATMDPLQR